MTVKFKISDKYEIPRKKCGKNNCIDKSKLNDFWEKIKKKKKLILKSKKEFIYLQ